jgi:hypothetical protein
LAVVITLSGSRDVQRYLSDCLKCDTGASNHANYKRCSAANISGPVVIDERASVAVVESAVERRVV